MKNYKNMSTKSFSAIPFVETSVTRSKTDFKKASISSFLLIVIIQFSLNISILNSQGIKLISPTIYGIQNLTDIEKSGDNLFVSGDSGLLLKIDTETNTVEKVESGVEDEMIIDMSFNSLGLGITICSKGSVLFTSNSGLNWSKTLLDSTEYLTSVNFITDDIAIITAMNGIVYKSTNSGLEWDRIKLNTDISIRTSIGLGDDLVLCGDIGLIARSSDEGKTWNISTKSYIGNILSVSISNNSLIIGANSGSFYSNDVGNTWVRPTQQEGFRAKIVKTFGSNTYAVTDSGKIYISIDEGKSWELKSSTEISVNGIFIFSEESWIIVGENSQLMLTSNGGQNYSVLLPSVRDNYVSTNYLNDGSVFILSTQGISNTLEANDISSLSTLPTGFYRKSQVVGDRIYAFDETGRVFESVDKGITWELNSIIPGTQIFNDFTKIENTIYAVNTIGDVYKFDNDNWTSVKVKDSLNLTTIRFFDKNNGFVCGSLGKIYFTTNSGNSWTEATTPSTGMITDGVVLNSEDAFISSYKGYFLNTTDKGATWVKTSVDSVNDRILSLDIHHDMILGIASTASGKLLLTDDAFNTWTTIYDFGHLITDVAINNNDFVAIGQYSLILTGDLLQSSVEDFTYDNTISVYPNPSNGEFSISISNQELLTDNEFINSAIEVIDVNGKIVYEKKISNLSNNNTFKLDLGSMFSGSYILKITTPTKTYSRKLHLNK